jgi:hypothetical protein
MRPKLAAVLGCTLSLSACELSQDEADVAYHVASDHLTGCQNATAGAVRCTPEFHSTTTARCCECPTSATRA